jgi:predicted ArsR family transcriptional regulator
MSTITILNAVTDAPQATPDIGVPAVKMRELEVEGLVRKVGVRRLPRKGRPAHMWRTTDKGRKRVKRARAAGRI